MNHPALAASCLKQAPFAASGAGRARALIGNPAVIFASLFVVALAPALRFSLLRAMMDYENHLACMFVLAHAGTAHAQPY
jgi:hypothetical protein